MSGQNVGRTSGFNPSSIDQAAAGRNETPAPGLRQLPHDGAPRAPEAAPTLAAKDLVAQAKNAEKQLRANLDALNEALRKVDPQKPGNDDKALNQLRLTLDRLLPTRSGSVPLNPRSKNQGGATSDGTSTSRRVNRHVSFNSSPASSGEPSPVATPRRMSASDGEGQNIVDPRADSAASDDGVPGDLLFESGAGSAADAGGRAARDVRPGSWADRLPEGDGPGLPPGPVDDPFAAFDSSRNVSIKINAVTYQFIDEDDGIVTVEANLDNGDVPQGMTRVNAGGGGGGNPRFAISAADWRDLVAPAQ